MLFTCFIILYNIKSIDKQNSGVINTMNEIKTVLYKIEIIYF